MIAFKNRHISLTQRETECLFCVILGMTAQEIGKTVSLSRRTVEDYILTLRDKFNCTNRYEIVTQALMSGFPILDLLNEFTL